MIPLLKLIAEHGFRNGLVIDMDKLFGVAVVLFISLLTVYGVFEIGIYQYQYYIEKGLSEENSSLFSFMGNSDWNCTYNCLRSPS